MNGKGIVWLNVAVYCVLAFALLWIPFFGATLTGEDGNASNAWQRILGVMGPYSPLVAAVLMRAVVTREGFRDAHLGVRASRWHFWLIALLLPFLWNCVQDASQLLFGFAEMNWAKMSGGLYRVPINLFGGLAIFIGHDAGTPGAGQAVENRLHREWPLARGGARTSRGSRSTFSISFRARSCAMCPAL